MAQPWHHPDDKPVPAVTGVDSYITERVNDQIDRYYRPKALVVNTRAGDRSDRAEVIEGQPQDRGAHRHRSAAAASVDRQPRARVDRTELREVVGLQRLQPHELT
jgi:hypothetical protein